MSDESIWIERAQSAEAKLKALQSQVDPLRERVRDVCAALCAREQRDGTFTIDYSALVKKLGTESAAELQQLAGAEIMAQAYAMLGQLVGKTVTILSAEPGQKPKLRIHAAPAGVEHLEGQNVTAIATGIPRVKRKYTKRAKAA